MLAQIHSCTLIGLSVFPIHIEVDAAGGLPAWDIVGLPDAAVKESKERVRTAIKNAGFDFPPRRVVVNLAPAHLKKEGPIFDLPIAIAILVATEQLTIPHLDQYIILGELGLDGTLRKVKGVLPISVDLAQKAKKTLIVPEDNQEEGAIGGSPTYGFQRLEQVVSFLQNPATKEPSAVPKIEQMLANSTDYAHDFQEIKGQQEAKRALEIAASGSHNLLMVGSPGSGKTMLARALPSIMPNMTIEESLDVTKIYSIAGLLPGNQPLITQRPYRSPHNNASQASIIGGGRVPIPGEISLSHHGVLFMDEFPEYKKDVLESLRQPLEEGWVTVSRVQAQLTYPASFLLIAAMNPCPCGFLGDPKKECTCSDTQAQRYRNRVSGPLLDRFDLQLEISPLDYNDLYNDRVEESSLSIRKRVEQARLIQQERFQRSTTFTNGRMTGKEVTKYCRPDQRGQHLLETAFRTMDLSARAHNRILKVARTIADLEGKDQIASAHIAEALQYRALDRHLFRK